MKMPWAVSGRRNARPLSSSTGPMYVRSMPLNCLGSVNWPLTPQFGQLMSSRPPAGTWPCFCSYASMRWSARNRLWQLRHSVSGSVKVATWPLASHTSRARITLESSPTMSSRSWTM